MNENDKIKFYREKIESIYPDLIKLNKEQVCRVLNISGTSFVNIINKNDIYKLPKFKVEETTRKDGKPYRNYKFDINDVAYFLAHN